MNFRTILLLIATLSLAAYVVFLLFFQDTASDIEPINVPATIPGDVNSNQQQIVVLEDTITSKSGEGSYSAAGLKDNPFTKKVTEQGLYSNTLDSNYYELMFYEPNGTITVLLYKEPLTFARRLAEEQLKTLLPYTEDEFCDMDIRVRVNRNVSPEFSTFDIGLSFCPGSHPLEL